LKYSLGGNLLERQKAWTGRRRRGLGIGDYSW
jgi:hypothetical protein